MAIAKPVGDLGPARGDLQGNRLALALHDQRHRDARVQANQLLYVLEALDAPAIDADDHIAGMDAARLGGAARLHLADFGRRERLAIGHEQQGQDDDREDEVRDRPAGNNRRPLPETLAVKRHGPFGGAEVGQPRDR